MSATCTNRVIVALLVFAPSVGIAATIDVVATADGYVSLVTGATDTASDVVEVNDAATLRTRGLFEFNLAAVPPGTPIETATLLGTFLSVDPGEPGTPPQIIVAGYAGNGLITAGDATVAASLLGGAVLLPPQVLQDFAIGLETDFIETLEGSFLGLRLQPVVSENSRIRIASLENLLPNTLNPTLRLVTQDVVPIPEPSTVLLLGAGVAGLWARMSSRGIL